MIYRPTTLGPQDLQEIQQLEESLWQAEIRFSKAMEDILAEDFFEFGRSGRTYSRKECLTIPSRSRIDAVIPLPNFAARYITDDVVQVTYRRIVTDGTDVQEANRSSIWRRTPQGWKLEFHQGTAIPR